MDLNESWLEALLKRNNYENGVIKVDNIEKINALGNGENYLSLITRIKADVTLGSGRTKKLSLIMKTRQDSPALKKMHNTFGFFCREIVVYRDILPKMEDIMIEAGDTGETLWGKCYDTRLYDTLLFEDLNASGYSMAERRKQLGLNSALFVVRNLAKFHALSCILLERSEIPLDMFGKHIWNRNIPEILQYLPQSFSNLAEVMDTWGDEWKEAKARVLNSIPQYSCKFEKYISDAYDGFTVLAHGDCWTNNMLFRFGLNSDSPISMKFLDLQLSYTTTPAHDLHCFLPSSVTLETRKSHLDTILEVYSQNLAINLRKFGFTGDIPSVQNIKDEFNKTTFLSFFFTLLTVPVVLAEKKDALDLEEYLGKCEDAKSKGEPVNAQNLMANLTESGKFIIQHAIKNAIRDNVI